MDAHDALGRGDRRADLPRVHPRRGALEEDADRLAQDAERARDDEHADEQAGDRVGVGPAGREQDEARDDDARRRGEVGEDVELGGADVQARARAVQHARRRQVDQEPGGPRGQHPAAGDLGRVGEPPDRGPDDPEPEPDERDCVDQGREHLGAAPAEAPLGRGGPQREPGREQRQPERERIGEHVRRVREECERARREPDRNLDHGEAEDEPEGGRERLARGGVYVHRHTP